MADAADSVERSQSQLPSTDPFHGVGQHVETPKEPDEKQSDTAAVNPDAVVANKQLNDVPNTVNLPPQNTPQAPTTTTPVQVDSNPQDGQVYKVPDGVEDKTPNLT